MRYFLIRVGEVVRETLWLYEPLGAELVSKAATLGKSKSRIMRDALTDYFKKVDEELEIIEKARAAKLAAKKLDEGKLDV
jgi:hypothetical protein